MSYYLIQVGKPRTDDIPAMSEQEKARNAFERCIYHDREWQYDDHNQARYDAQLNMRRFVALINALEDADLRNDLKDLWMAMVHYSDEYDAMKEAMKIRINQMATSVAA